MNCTNTQNHLQGLLTGQITEDLKEAVTGHLAGCSECAAVLKAESLLMDVTVKVKATEPNPFAATRILAFLDSPGYPPISMRLPLWGRILQPAALTFALAAGILIGATLAGRENQAMEKTSASNEQRETLRNNLYITELTAEYELFNIKE